MDNPETLAILKIRHRAKTNKTKNRTHKTNQMSNMHSTNKTG